MSIGVGIVGYGSIGQLHHAVLDSLDGVRVAAIAGGGRPRSTHDIRIHSTLQDMLKDVDVQVVVICTPSGLHAEQACAALRAGRHVVVEKPLTLDLDAGAELVREARNRGLLLSVISQRRFAPAIQHLSHALRHKRMGRLILAEAHQSWHRDSAYYASKDWRREWGMGGGVLMNQAVHAVDLLRWLGGPVEEVYGVGATMTHHVEVEDTAAAVLRFTSGALGVISATTSAPTGQPAELRIVAERGVATIGEQNAGTWQVPGMEAPPPDPAAGSGADQPLAISDAGHRRQWTDIVAALTEGRDPAVPGEAGLASAALVVAIYEAWQHGQLVRPQHQISSAVDEYRTDSELITPLGAQS